MSHRTRRWTCCDVREKGKFGSTGCQSRFHMPSEKDPDYKAAVDQKDDFFINEFTKLGQEGEEVKTANWALQAKKIKIQQLDDIKDHVEEERKVVRRFKDPLDLDEKVRSGSGWVGPCASVCLCPCVSGRLAPAFGC